MSPITSTPALLASSTDQCGAGCVSGTPGASTSAATFDQSSVRRSAVAMPACVRLGDACGAVVEGNHVGAARDQRLRARKARAAEPEHGDRLPAKLMTGIIAA